MRNFEKTALMIVGLVGVIECAIHFVMYLSGKPLFDRYKSVETKYYDNEGFEYDIYLKERVWEKNLKEQKISNEIF